MFECKEYKVSLWWFLVIALLRFDIVSHTELALHCHNIFRLNSWICVCQANCSAEKKSRRTGLSVYVCVSVCLFPAII